MRLRVVLTLALPLLCLIAAHTLFTPIHRTNDDTGMDMLARGIGFSSTPTSFLMFSNILLGKLLVVLYGTFETLPWYRLFALGTQLLSSTVIAWVILSPGVSATRVIPLTVYLVVFDLMFYVDGAFTITAALPATAAVLFWLHHAARGRRLGWPALAGFLALLLLSTLIRYHSTLLIVLLGTPAIAVYAVRLRSSSRRSLVALALPWLLAVALVGSLVSYDRGSYAASPEWRDFHRIHRLISDFIDFERVQFAAEPDAAFEEVGWSRNDYQMLLEWFFVDEERYSIARMERVLSAFPRHTLWNSEPTRRCVRDFLEDPDLPLMLGALLLPVLLAFRRVRARVPLGLAVAMFGLMSVVLIVLFHRFPPRIYEPMLALLSCLALFEVEAGRLVGQRRGPALWLPIVCLAAVCWLAPSALLRLSQRTETVRTRSVQMNDALRALAPRSDQLYVIWGAVFPYELILPMDSMREMRTFNIFSLGSDTRSPLNQARLVEFGIEDLTRAIYERPDVFVIGNPRRNAIFTRYVAEHHGERVVAERVAEFNAESTHLFSVYRFVRAGG